MLDAATLDLLVKAGSTGILCAMWIVTMRFAKEERAEWREQVIKVIEANTTVLSQTAKALGEVSASQMNCPGASGAYDERGYPYRRRHSNGEGGGEIG